MRTLLTLSLMLPAIAAGAQSPIQAPASAALHYETVSIHDGKPGADGSVTMSGPGDPNLARLDLSNWTAENMLLFAFSLSSFDQVQGVPEKLNRRLYVIHAQAGEETAARLKSMSADQAWIAQGTMLQQILVERFRLRFHFITREAPSFQLRTGKPKLKRSGARPLAEGDGRTEDSTDPTQPMYSESCLRRGCTLTARGQSMAWLASMLNGQLHGPISDGTGLAGLYDFTLEWNNQQSTIASRRDEELFPPLEAALAHQLGLKLEHGTAPTRVLVVDNLEPPTPN